jgi:hypothetical protein
LYESDDIILLLLGADHNSDILGGVVGLFEAIRLNGGLGIGNDTKVVFEFKLGTPLLYDIM